MGSVPMGSRAIACQGRVAGVIMEKSGSDELALRRRLVRRVAVVHWVQTTTRC